MLRCRSPHVLTTPFRVRRDLIAGAIALLAACVTACGSDSTGTPDHPVPTISRVIPNQVEAGSVGFMLSVEGSGFVEGSRVQWNGASRSTSFVSASRLTATIPASDVATDGIAQVTVSSPAPGGGTSAAARLTVEPAAVASIEVSLDEATLVPQQTLALSATARSANGDVLQGRAVTWTSSADGVAAVDGHGLVTAVAPGSVSIIAASDGVETSVAVEVVPGGIADPAGGTLSGGDVVLTFPPGAVSTAMAITIRPNATPPSTAEVVPGTAWDLGPDGSAFGQRVTVAIVYDEAKVPTGVDERDLVVHRWDGTVWQPLPDATVDAAANRATGTTSEFSTFGLLPIETEPTWTRLTGHPGEEWAADIKKWTMAAGKLWVVTGHDPVLFRSTSDGITWDVFDPTTVGLPAIAACGDAGGGCLPGAIGAAGSEDELVVTMLLEFDTPGGQNAEGHFGALWTVRGNDGGWTVQGPPTPGLDQAKPSPGSRNFRVRRFNAGAVWQDRVVFAGESQWWLPFATTDQSFFALTTDAGKGWMAFAQDQEPFGGSMRQTVGDLAGSPFGFYAVGLQANRFLMWYSVDGVSWTTRPDPSLAFGAADDESGTILHGPSGLVHARVRTGATPQVVVWLSQDGSTWQEIVVDEGMTPALRGFVTNGRYVLHGYGGSPMWVSDDGRSWKRLPDLPISFPVIVGVGDRILAFRGDSVRMLELR